MSSYRTSHISRRWRHNWASTKRTWTFTSRLMLFSHGSSWVLLLFQILTKLSTSIHEQLPWLQDMFGGTMDKLTMITLILGHLVFFIGSFMAIIFVNGPSLTRVSLLIVIPLNCLAALQDTHSLTYQQLAWLLALTIPGIYGFQLLPPYFWVGKVQVPPNFKKAQVHLLIRLKSGGTWT